MKENLKLLVDELGLEPHPEGGYYKETYRSKGLIANNNLNDKFKGDRNYSTCIYFLLTSDNFSAFHRINQDEIWHFYQGSPVLIHMISENGEYSKVEVGNNITDGQMPQFVIPAGYWFAAQVKNEEAYSLVGCTVSPGFDFRDFELAERTELTELFPQHSNIIQNFTRL